jgi:hypothetical protein
MVRCADERLEMSLARVPVSILSFVILLTIAPSLFAAGDPGTSAARQQLNAAASGRVASQQRALVKLRAMNDQAFYEFLAMEDVLERRAAGAGRVRGGQARRAQFGVRGFRNIKSDKWRSNSAGAALDESA